VKVNICGVVSTCPESVQTAMKEIQEMTASNSRLVLNICFAYNSSQELERCTGRIRDQVRLKLIKTKRERKREREIE